ncbi:Uu.00g073290.m01.CDS01 [Anthostomella pinea]|uniref:Uu.00g073290.m01.CDS01 n=1 Tax=Anthostomella pinea TaxID=933095 RepID=A0AAI8YNT8_9PEZI|nr:Uu.00g073290.m01.CDS01 [Anthostomella pinea]
MPDVPLLSPLPASSSSLPANLILARCRVPADTAAIASVYLAAFRGSGFEYWWAPSAAAMRDWVELRFGVEDSAEALFKIVDEDGSGGEDEDGDGRQEEREGGKVVAFAKWNVPPGRIRDMLQGGRRMGEMTVGGTAAGGGGTDGAKAEWNGKGDVVATAGDMSAAEKKSRQKPPPGADVAAYEELSSGAKKLADKWGAKDKLGLSVLCVDPSYGGRGLGFMLLKTMLDVADAEGVTAYVDALRRATPLYERHGFVAVDSIEYDGGSVVIDIMIREPRRGS